MGKLTLDGLLSYVDQERAKIETKAKRKVKTMFDCLTHAEKDVLRIKEDRELPHAEAVLNLNISEDAARARLTRAMATLRKWQAAR